MVALFAVPPPSRSGACTAQRANDSAIGMQPFSECRMVSAKKTISTTSVRGQCRACLATPVSSRRFCAFAELSLQTWWCSRQASSSLASSLGCVGRLSVRNGGESRYQDWMTGASRQKFEDACRMSSPCRIRIIGIGKGSRLMILCMHQLSSGGSCCYLVGAPGRTQEIVGGKDGIRSNKDREREVASRC